MHPRVIDILASVGTPAQTIRPTALYNEGWMLQLILDWAHHYAPETHRLAFLPDARWYAEALLRPQFLARWRGDNLAESWSHADGVIGHFDIGTSGKGDLTLRDAARQLVVVEAKIFSKLSSGTKNATSYDQVALPVACVAETIRWAGITPPQMARLGFFVAAPKSQIECGVFRDLVTKDSIRQRVQDRVDAYRGDRDAWFDHWFIPTLDAIDLDVLSWEALLEGLDPSYRAFYDQCLLHNGPKVSS